MVYLAAAVLRSPLAQLRVLDLLSLNDGLQWIRKATMVRLPLPLQVLFT